MSKKIFVIILACILALPLFACSGDDGTISVDPNDPFTGDWYLNTEIGIFEFIYFYGNGRGCRQVDDIYLDMTYTYDENTLEFDVYIDGEEQPVKHIYEYRAEDMDLFLTDHETGEELHFVRQTSK